MVLVSNYAFEVGVGRFFVLAYLALLLLWVGVCVCVWVDFNRSSLAEFLHLFLSIVLMALPLLTSLCSSLDSRPFSWLETRTYQIWVNVASVS